MEDGRESGLLVFCLSILNSNQEFHAQPEVDIWTGEFCISVVMFDSWPFIIKAICFSLCMSVYLHVYNSERPSPLTVCMCNIFLTLDNITK